jgi:hypothetical protein
VLCAVVVAALRSPLQRDLEAVLRDEPGWAVEIWIEPFELVVADEVSRLAVDRSLRRRAQRLSSR